MAKIKPDQIHMPSIDMPSTAEDAAINAAALSDPDDLPLTDAQLDQLRPAHGIVPGLGADYRKLRGAQKTPLKEKISLRLDADIVEHFKAGGKGWQSRLNLALRQIVMNDV